MQIPSIPMPIVTGAAAQDLAAKAVPNVQAAQPMTQNAVKAPPKNERSNQSRSNKDRGGKDARDSDTKKGRDKDEGEARGSSVNISV